MPLTTDDIDYVVEKLRKAADKLEHGDALSAAILLRLAFRRFPELLSTPQRELLDKGEWTERGVPGLEADRSSARDADPSEPEKR